MGGRMAMRNENAATAAAAAASVHRHELVMGGVVLRCRRLQHLHLGLQQSKPAAAVHFTVLQPAVHQA